MSAVGRSGLSLALACALGLLVAAPASAAQPWWQLSSGARPTDLPRQAGAGAERELVLTAENVGDASAHGSGETAVSILDTLPAGVSVDEALPAGSRVAAAIPYAGTREALVCEARSASVVSCETEASVAPYAQIEMRIAVTVGPEAHTGELNRATIAGGGAPGASVSQPLTIVESERAQPTGFGVEGYAFAEEEAGGVPAARAASHPFQQTFGIAFDQGADATPVQQAPDARPAALPRDLEIAWPAGLTLDPFARSVRCTRAELLAPVGADADECPAGSAVGVVSATAYDPRTALTETFVVPLFDLEPPPGQSSSLGFYIPQLKAPVFLEGALGAGGVVETSTETTQAAGLLGARVTIWGVPGLTGHDAQRGWGCLLRAREAVPGSGELTSAPCNATEGTQALALLTLPDVCAQAGESAVRGGSWAQPAGTGEPLAATPTPPLGGCNEVPFRPTLAVSGDTGQASAPDGLRVQASVSQEPSENPLGTAASAIQSLSVTLPAGFVLNPSVANGLAACGEGQFAQAACPEASKVASVRIDSPVLPGPLEGAAYLASPQNLAAPPQENPFASLLAIYVLAKDPVSGTLVTFAGEIEAGEEGGGGASGLAPGQVRVSLDGLPQLPVADAELDFFGGARALLATPAHCGTYEARASLAPWSGEAPAGATLPVAISSAPGGGPCPGAGALGFAPGFTAGAGDINAGASGSFTVAVAREDGNQPLSSLRMTLPPGVSAALAGVPPCSGAQAAAQACPAASRIGEASVKAGFGGQPLTLAGGSIYLTEAYEGAPFGLAITIPVSPGPFALGTIALRATIAIDPHTGALTIATTTPLPQMLRGFALEIRELVLTVNRSGLVWNPTRCAAQSIHAAIDGGEGANANLENGFQVTNCAALGFAPTLSLASGASASEKGGAGLTAKVAQPAAAPAGSSGEANLSGVQFELPSQLIVRHSGAPAPGATVGHAVLRTPLSPAALEGPAVLAEQHAGEATPGLTLALSGDGVSLDLEGKIESVVGGRIAFDFANLPDLPVQSLELSLPQGSASLLAARKSLCSGSLSVPAAILAQNGMSAQPNVTLAVGGCSKRRALTRAQELAKALAACRKQHRRDKRKRVACERLARKRYGGHSRKSARKATKRTKGGKENATPGSRAS